MAKKYVGGIGGRTWRCQTRVWTKIFHGSMCSREQDRRRLAPKAVAQLKVDPEQIVLFHTQGESG